MKNILFLLVLFSTNVLPCSFSDSTEEFKVDGNVRAVIPDQPNFTLLSVTRGYKDYIGSCSDAGIIKLKVDPEPKEPTGYVFSIAEGEFEDALFNDSILIRNKAYTKPGEYSFVWLDGNSDEQEPIRITVKIIAVSIDGGTSAPQFLRIENPGKKQWWRFW